MKKFLPPSLLVLFFCSAACGQNQTYQAIVCVYQQLKTINETTKNIETELDRIEDKKIEIERRLSKRTSLRKWAARAFYQKEDDELDTLNPENESGAQAKLSAYELREKIIVGVEKTMLVTEKAMHGFYNDVLYDLIEQDSDGSRTFNWNFDLAKIVGQYEALTVRLEALGIDSEKTKSCDQELEEVLGSSL